MAVAAGEPMRVLKEALRRHREKLPRPLGRVVVEGDEATLLEGPLELFATLRDAQYPVATVALERWHAINLTVEHVDEMRKLMNYHTAGPTIPEPPAIDDPRPRQHHAPP